ncbi:hypothetical protein GYMLUDRAFT_37033 [Collybiopsis luxurians FD-317 M1]|nr:hypothetical protein GYMLUDRAFT_37033 [Collybiopsis luxurians FD-317 M1]
MWPQLLSDQLLDELVQTVLTTHPSLTIILLSSLGSRIHASAIRVLFSHLVIADDSCLFVHHERFQRSLVYPLITNPNRYSPNVKTLTITIPILPENLEQPDDTQGLDALRPLTANDLSLLLQCCPNLERLCWESSLRPPDGLCEQLCSFNIRLKHFLYRPRLPKTSSRRIALIKWDASSLPLLSSLPITTISLSGLSQAGTRALVWMLRSLGQDSVLENLTIDLMWFDESLCEAIAASGRKIRRLHLSSNGTKLNDNGLISILESCDGIEELVLDEIQGRISRSMWTKPNVYPSALRCLRIYFSDTGPHHSWAADHLDSLHAFPLERLSEICISTRPGFPVVEDATAIYTSSFDDVVSLKPLPSIISERLQACKALTKLHCDFWTLRTADVKSILESCLKLKNLHISLDAPFIKLLGLASTFAALPNLYTVSVTINPAHASGTPLPLNLPSFSVLQPSASSVSHARADSHSGQSHPVQTLTKNADDPYLPLLRDVRRFVRKCPKLRLLGRFSVNHSVNGI